MWTSARDENPGEPSHFCELYLHDLYQVLTVKIVGKSTQTSSSGGEKCCFKILQSILFFLTRSALK